MFFDLGDTLIKKESKEYQYVQGAHTYLKDLVEQGYTLNLVVNIPQKWGKNYKERFRKLQSFLGSKWSKGAEAFDWDIFTHILLPPDDKRRKPDPHLFQQAQRLAAPCRAIFQGETAVEVKTAIKLGMEAYQIGQPERSYFLPKTAIPRWRSAFPKR